MSGSPESGYTDWSNLIPETVNLLMLQRLKLSIVALFRRSGLHRRGLDVPRLLWHIHVRQLQSLAGVTADLIGQRRAVVESAPVGGNDGVQAVFPASGHLFREDLGQHVQHDRRRGGCAWRGAYQGGDGAIGVTDHLGAELQGRALLGVKLDYLHTLPGGNQLPVLGVGLG